jgi:hypothetical protein
MIDGAPRLSPQPPAAAGPPLGLPVDAASFWPSLRDGAWAAAFHRREAVVSPG